MLKVGDKIERSLSFVFEQDKDLSAYDVVEVLASSTVGGRLGAARLTVRGNAMAVDLLVEDDVEAGAFEIARQVYWQLRDKVLNGIEYDEDCVPSDETCRNLETIENIASELKAFLERGAIEEFVEGMRRFQPVDLWYAGQIDFFAENCPQLEAERVAAVADMNTRIAALHPAAA